MNVAHAASFDRLAIGHRTARPDWSRAAPDQLQRQVEIASSSPVVKALLLATDSILLVLNAERQIVAGSKVPSPFDADLIGRRPGEVFDCVNGQGPRGCGTAPACETCGALGAILAAQRTGRPTEAECFLRSVANDGMAFEFNVRAAPVEIGGAEFTAVALRDISGDKRRQALEQIFFHDVLNTVGGLRGWSSRLLAAESEHRRAAERIDALSRRIEREIRDHRDLVLAENGTLTLSPRHVAAAELLREVEALFASHRDAKDRHLDLRVDPPDLELWTDPSLLQRVLVNMVRNALEATAPGGVVRLRAVPYGPSDARTRFSVHNEGAIPAEVQHRIFQRSFSTKGERGRGLGTYSMKLLGERYLGGEVSFTSSVAAGTTFSIVLPPPRPTRVA